MKEEVRYKGDDMSCSEKGNVLTSAKGYQVRRRISWGSFQEIKSCRDRGRR